MTTTLAPLTPADCDLRDFPFMKLDVKRLRDSDMALTETPESCWAAVLLWSASWHQVPAASLPDNDRVLSHLAGYGRVVKEWLKHKAGALHGWVKCADGRLYHKTVAETANAAWHDKLAHQFSKMLERLRKLNKAREEKKQPPVAAPTFDGWLASGRVDPVNTVPESSGGIPAEDPSTSGGTLPEFRRKTLLEGEGEGEGDVLNTHTLPASVIDPPAPQPQTAQAPTGGVCDAPSGGNLPAPAPVSATVPALEDATTLADSLPAYPSNPKTQMASAVCLALKSEGMASVNPSHPELHALLEAGASVDSFVQAARVMRDKGINPSRQFAYVVGTVKGQMAQAAQIAAAATSAPLAGQPGAIATRPLNKQEALEASNREVGRQAAERIRARMAAEAAAQTPAQGASYAS